jgi:DNA-binding NarL/FixJ family response regulator
MNVLLVDDHPLILSALRAVIRGLGDDVTVVGVNTGREARATLKGKRDFDLVLLDLQLEDSDGFELLTEFRGQYPALPIVVVSASDRASDVIRAIDAGAMGFVPKRASNDTLFEALRLVMSGGIYVPPMTLGVTPAPPATPKDGDTVPDIMRPHPIEEVHEMTSAPGKAVPPAPTSLDALGLSKRQADVLGFMLQGLPNKMIAREMHLSVDTIKDHVAAVLRALGVSSRTQAVLAISQMTRDAGGGATPAWRRSQR